MASNGISIQQIRGEAEWQSLFANVRQKHMTQTWAFGEAKRVNNWTPVRLAVKHENEALAICQVLYKTIAGIQVAARINMGPLIFDGHTDKAFDILRAIRGHWRYLKRGVLLIAPALPHTHEGGQQLRSMGFRLRNNYSWKSSRLDLTLTQDALYKSLYSKWRNALKNSERSDLRFVYGNSMGDVEWIVERHIENSKQKGFTGPAPEFLFSLYRASPQDFTVYRAIHDDRSVAGIVAYSFCDVAHYYLGWNGAKGRRLNAGNFLLWNVALAGC